MLTYRVLRRGVWRSGLAVCGMLALSACGSHYAQVPARLDLEPYGRVGLVTFSTEQADKQWSTLATHRAPCGTANSNMMMNSIDMTPLSSRWLSAD